MSETYRKPVFAGLMDVAIHRSAAYAGAEQVRLEVLDQIIGQNLPMTIMQDDAVLGFCTMDSRAYAALVRIVKSAGLTPGTEYACFEMGELKHPEAYPWLKDRINPMTVKRGIPPS